MTCPSPADRKLAREALQRLFSRHDARKLRGSGNRPHPRAWCGTCGLLLADPEAHAAVEPEHAICVTRKLKAPPPSKQYKPKHRVDDRVAPPVVATVPSAPPPRLKSYGRSNFADWLRDKLGRSA